MREEGAQGVARDAGLMVYTLPNLIGKSGVFADGDWVETKDQDSNGDVRLLQLADVGDGTYINKSKRFLTSARARQLNCTYLEPGDILVARMPDPLGRACIFPGDSRSCVVAVDICIIRPDPDLVATKWLLYQINSPIFRAEVTRLGRGATRARISRKNLGTVGFDVPPLEQQKRIARILDKADELRAKRRRAITKLDELVKSVFLEMFGDPVTNQKGWGTKTFSDVGTLDRGKSKHRPRNAPELLDGPYPLVQTGDVAKARYYLNTYTQTYSELGLRQSRMWPRGTLCITIAANIANTAILTFDACFPDSVVGFTPSSTVRTEYIQHWLSFLQKMLEENAPQVAQKNINLRILRGLNVPVPDITLQNRFVEVVKAIQSQTAFLSEHFMATDALLTSLQARAFSGDLTSEALDEVEAVAAGS